MALKLTQGTTNALNALKGRTEFVTMAELNEAGNSIAVAQLTSLRKNGLVEVIDVEVPTTIVKTMKAYRLVDGAEDIEIEVSK